MILYFYGYYGLITWLPNYVQSQVGMQSGGWITAAGYIAMIIGTAGGGKIADQDRPQEALPHRHHRHGDLRPVPGLLGQQQQHPRAHAALRRLLRHAHRHPRDVHRRVLPDAPAQHRRRLHVQHRPSGAFVAPILMGKLVDMNMISVAIATVTISYVLCSLATLPIKEREYDASNVAAELED